MGAKFQSLWLRVVGCILQCGVTRYSMAAASPIEGKTVWFQKEVTLQQRSKGCHLLDEEILSKLPEISNLKVGTAHIFIKHTTASLILCENWDKEVRTDMTMVMDKIVPEKWNYAHCYEGPDDMPAHAKCALMGTSVTIPITKGKFNTGTWQGLWLCEHRYNGGGRKLVVTINGCQ
ncbi:hypothetical protein EB796_012312 [Bugula neritina]|uniref:YjbQ n=1 Tax=Bugula neritina TaxID=10212 RepID=A0A7J7JUK6_BUGNE|nr:hypothetical protein EB796_012312 [Bugula neritina]